MSVSTAAIRRPPATTEVNPTTIRVASLLPGLTDVIHDLDRSSTLVATSHECHSKCVGQVATVTSAGLLHTDISALEVSAGWNATLFANPPNLATHICSFYDTDIESLAAARPTVVLTHLRPQRQFSDPTPQDLRRAIRSVIPSVTHVISADPHTLDEIYALHLSVSRVLHASRIAINLVETARHRLQHISQFVSKQLLDKKPPSLAVVQWTDPLYLAGDWVPEIVRLSAIHDPFTSVGQPSVSVSVGDLFQVEVIVFSLCALDLNACRKGVNAFWRKHNHMLRNWPGTVIITDSTKLFSRVALSNVVQSAEVVAEIVTRSNFYGHRGSLWQVHHPLISR